LTARGNRRVKSKATPSVPPIHPDGRLCLTLWQINNIHHWPVIRETGSRSSRPVVAALSPFRPGVDAKLSAAVRLWISPPFSFVWRLAYPMRKSVENNGSRDGKYLLWYSFAVLKGLYKSPMNNLPNTIVKCFTSDLHIITSQSFKKFTENQVDILWWSFWCHSVPILSRYYNTFSVLLSLSLSFSVCKVSNIE